MRTVDQKLVLGTVQLGMKYGLNNHHGQPDKKEAFAILDKAWQSGIDTFDTAWAYGTAEDVLGGWIKERSLQGKAKVISKMKPHALNDYPDGTKADEIVRKEIEKSLKRIGVDSLHGYLFHSPHYIYLDHVVEGLRKIKTDGLAKNIGVSIYDEPEALQAAGMGVDLIQIPYNAFDQRLDATDFFDTAKKKKVTVFARSPFLQGALLMQPEELPDHLAYLKSYLKEFISIAKKHSLTQQEAALMYSFKSCQADYIVFGAETADQVEEDILTAHRSAGFDEPEFFKEIKETFGDLNRGAINPSLWSKIKPQK